MQTTPKGLRRHIAILGRRNAGKSRLANALAGQPVSIVSSQAGTTTDPVEKALELHPLGPVVLIDTAGIDDCGELGQKRNAASLAILKRCDLALLVTEGDAWGKTEADLAAKMMQIPYLIARNKAETGLMPVEQWRRQCGIAPNIPIIDISAKEGLGLEKLPQMLAQLAGIDESRPLMADLLPRDGVALLVVPIDSGAPKGRLILPQVQAIRDCLDHDKMCFVTTLGQLPHALSRLAPDLVVCDSQVAKETAAATPCALPFTTFSILMARYKGDLARFAQGARALMKLAPGDNVLIQEACSHHAQKDDIGRVKIPAILRRLTGGELEIRHSQGKDFSHYSKDLKIIIHCGACVMTARQMQNRQDEAENCQIPMTNYGMTMTFAQGLLERALAPFGIGA